MINSAVYDNIVGRVLLVMSHDKIIQHKADKKENCHITNVSVALSLYCVLSIFILK